MFEIGDSDWLCDKVASITTDDSRPQSLTVPLSRGGTFGRGNIVVNLWQKRGLSLDPAQPRSHARICLRAPLILRRTFRNLLCASCLFSRFRLNYQNSRSSVQWRLPRLRAYPKDACSFAVSFVTIVCAVMSIWLRFKPFIVYPRACKSILSSPASYSPGSAVSGTTGPFLESPGKFSGPLRHLVHLYLKTDICIRLKPLLWREPLLILRMRE